MQLGAHFGGIQCQNNFNHFLLVFVRHALCPATCKFGIHQCSHGWPPHAHHIFKSINDMIECGPSLLEAGTHPDLEPLPLQKETVHLMQKGGQCQKLLPLFQIDCQKECVILPNLVPDPNEPHGSQKSHLDWLGFWRHGCNDGMDFQLMPLH